MIGPGTYDDRTATPEPCVCGKQVTRRAQCPVWRRVERGRYDPWLVLEPWPACPLPARGSHTCVSYQGRCRWCDEIHTGGPEACR